MYYQWKDARFQYTDAKNLVGTLLLLQVVENNLGGFSFKPQSLTTTQEQPTTFLAFPSLSILQSLAHSPSFLLLSTFIKGMLCSLQSAWTSFLYRGSLQLSDRTHNRA